MSGDREARALAAGDSVIIADDEGRETTFRLRPITAQHLCDMERDALRSYKRQYLSTYSENPDLIAALLGDASRETIARKIEEVAGWGLEQLPRKTSYDAASLPITAEARALIAARQGEAPPDDDACRAILGWMLDSGDLSPDEAGKVCGRRPKSATVRYDQWWVTARIEGMVAFIAASVRYDRPDVTREQVARWPVAKIVEAARAVERLSVPDLGNT